MIFADSIRQTAATARPAASSDAGRAVDATDISALRALRLLFAPARFLLDPLVVGREVLQLGDPAHLEVRTRSERGAAGPFGRLLAGGRLDDPEAVEQLLGLAVGAVGDERFLGAEVDDEALSGIRQPFTGEQHPGLDHRLVVTAHVLDDLGEVELLVRLDAAVVRT